jgi:hydrogenase-4 component B
VLTLSVYFDGLARIFLLPILLLGPVLAVYSYHYLGHEGRIMRALVSQFFFSLLLIAMILVTLAANMLTFALAWELMSLASFFLVVFDWEKQAVRDAGIRYLLFTQAGALCIFAAFGLLYGVGGSLSFDQLGQLPHGIKMTAFFLALVGFGSKAGVMPLHIWLPHAHPAAPSHVSALMSGVMIKMGVYGLLRFFFLLEDPSPLIARSILGLGISSGLLGVAYALGKHDIKRLLAYHSIENVGIILIGCGLGMLGLVSGNEQMAVLGFAGGLLHVLNHALFKSLLFLGAGAVLHATGTGTLDRLGGLLKTMPTTGRCFLTGSAAIAGLPPLNGFVSEFLIYYAGFLGLRLSGVDLLFSVAAVLSLAMIGGLASACFAKVMGIVFLGEPRSLCKQPIVETGASMRAAMILLATACLGIGLWPEPFIKTMAVGLHELAGLTGRSSDFLGSIPGNLALAARLCLAALVFMALIRHLLYRGKPIERTVTWGCGFTQASSRVQYTGVSFARSLVDFHRPLVKVETSYTGIDKIYPETARFGSRVADLAEIGLQRLLIDPLLGLVERLRWIQHGQIQLYIGYIVFTIAVLLLLID